MEAMNEHLLHFIWQYSHFDINDLKTNCHRPISLQSLGQHNTNAGPDFNFASMTIDGIQWHGAVEIHVKSSDWYKHNHHLDKKYNSVVLHVVWLFDKKVRNQRGEEVPCLELKPIVNKGLLLRYRHLMSQKRWIPCQDQIHRLDSFHISQYLQRLAVERLEKKTNQFVTQFETINNDWENTFYHSLCYSLGLKLNSHAFLKLSQFLPISVLSKHKDSLFQLEAMLFGVAGFLTDVIDEYGYALKKEFTFLKHKYSLDEMDQSEWLFLRLRPSSFPTLRLAQLAKLLTLKHGLFSKMMDCTDYSQLKKLFKSTTSDYWQSHYHFKKTSPFRNKSLGIISINTVIINTVCPLLFVYSQRKGLVQYQERAMQLLEDIKAETNTISRNFDKMGVTAKNAMESQALIQLKTNYCDSKKCLNCNLGTKLLS